MLRSQLNAENIIAAINSWVVDVVRYGVGVLKLSQDELRKLDIKTRQMMTMMTRCLHPRSNVGRLYLARKDGGGGERTD